MMLTRRAARTAREGSDPRRQSLRAAGYRTPAVRVALPTHRPVEASGRREVAPQRRPVAKAGLPSRQEKNKEEETEGGECMRRQRHTASQPFPVPARPQEEGGSSRGSIPCRVAACPAVCHKYTCFNVSHYRTPWWHHTSSGERWEGGGDAGTSVWPTSHSNKGVNSAAGEGQERVKFRLDNDGPLRPWCAGPGRVGRPRREARQSAAGQRETDERAEDRAPTLSWLGESSHQQTSSSTSNSKEHFRHEFAIL